MFKYLLVFSIFYSFTLLAQPSNDNCMNATVLCYNQIISGTTTNATAETCFDCADDYPNTIGFTSSSSVWYTFTTNALGGNVTVSISNINFNPNPSLGQALQAVIWEANSPCHGQSYNPIGVPQNNGTSNFTLSATGLLPNTTYYVMVNGDDSGPGVTGPAEATFDISTTGPGVAVVMPSASIAASVTVICQGDVVPVNYSTTNCQNQSALKWYYNNQFIQDSSSVNTAVFSEDGYLKLIIECGTECIYRDTTDSIFFEVTPIFVDASEDQLIELGESVILEGTGTSNPVWTPETGLSSTTTFTPTATPSETTTYFLTVTNGNCSLTDEVTVKIKEVITIPTGFTPNQDGTNDTWEIINIQQYPNNIVRVYDRSGQLVFKTTGYKNTNNNWNGDYLGKPLPVSTYYYVIDLRNGNSDSVYKGFVTIIR